MADKNTKGGHSDLLNNALEDAAKLQTEKEGLFERIGANRDLTRTLVKSGFCSKEQATAVEEFYPTKQTAKQRAAAAAAN